MYFKRLEMHGFKSFAEPVTIEFHPGVTCIVGPNGSGKSNISDAVRWVLGEQSPKQLRGNRMEEVIFSGTASRKSRGMAEVTLVIDNSQGLLPIDYNEVAITRRMYRSGESEYLINNNQCRLRDIRELIMDTGIGVEGYSIIGQGKIADVVSNKPEERRAIFEEAAGVMTYKSKKTESERKLSSASANLDRVNDIIGEIEGRIDGLREDSLKAQEYLKLKEASRELEVNITLRSIERLEAANKAIKEDLKALSAEAGEMEAEKREVDEELSKSREKSDSLEKLGNEARDALMANAEKINGIVSSSRLNAERLAALERDSVRLSAEAGALREKLDSERKNLAELEAQRLDTEKNLKEADERLREKVAAYEDVAAEASRIADAIDENKNRMYSLYNESTAKRSEIKSMESFKESLSQRQKQLAEERERASAGIKGYEEELEKACADRKKTESRLAEGEQRILGLKKDIDDLTEKRRELSLKENHAELEISRLNARKKTIEEMEANYEGYNGAVRFIMKRGMPGIVGTVSDIIKVPEGMEVAVETALGAALQNVICLRDKDAKDAIKLLKENRAGRLTFLPVESVKGTTAKVPASVLEDRACLGKASELVSADSKYGGIVEYLLGRVIITDGMQKAIDFSKTAAGVRFVTLEGEVVNASGAITGGKYRNATANLLERKSEVDRLTAEAAELEKEKERTALSLRRAEEEATGLAERLRAEEAALQELKASALSLDTRIEAMKSRSADAEAAAERHAVQLSAIEKDRKDADGLTEKLEMEAAQCEREADAARQAAEDLMKEHEQAKSRVEDASSLITATRMEKNRWDADMDGITRMTDRVSASCDELEEDISAREKEMVSVTAEREKLLSGSGASEGDLRAAEEEKLRLEGYIEQVTAERASLSASLTEMTARQTALGERLNSCRDRKYQEEIKSARNETQLDTLKERLWEDFEISYMQALAMRKEDFVMSSAQKESREIKARLRELGDVNVGAIQEYAQVSERYQFLTAQRQDITSAMEQLRSIIEDMDRTIKTRFKDKFDKIVVNFEEAFTTLFGGGHAELRLENEKDPLEAGIEIIAQPPGKKLQNINLMSGGEKTMTAIALMFAVLRTTPTPFCIMDEVEAALDDTNIDRFANYLRSFSDIQFTIVTHQKATMEHADVMYGITMPEKGVSKVLSLRMGDDFES